MRQPDPHTRPLKPEYAASLSSFLAAAPAAGAGRDRDATARCRASAALPALAPFYDALLNGVTPPAGAPVVGCLCQAVPEEFILACGAIPRRLCSADPALAREGEALLPADLCPVVKSVAGLARLGSGCDLVIVPATCEAKTQLGQVLGLRQEVYTLDLPRENDYLRHGEAWARAFEDLWAFLRRRLDAPRASRHDLKRACELTNRRTRAFRELTAFRAAHPGAIRALDYTAMAQASFAMPIPEWVAGVEAVLREAAAAPIPARPSRRLLLAGSPLLFPSVKLLEILDQAGVEVAADLLCSAFGRLYDPVVVDEDTDDGLVRALTLKYLAGSLCPCFLSLGKMLDAVLDRVATLGLDGVIHYTLRLCPVYELQAALLRPVLRDRGVPFLALKTDLGREDLGQLKTRIEAFVEMLA